MIEIIFVQLAPHLRFYVATLDLNLNMTVSKSK
jgi:hypothetical protein